jgi:hypothetical protein
MKKLLAAAIVITMLASCNNADQKTTTALDSTKLNHHPDSGKYL